MYAPETYKPSLDADKVPDGFGGWGEDGGKKRKAGAGEGAGVPDGCGRSNGKQQILLNQFYFHTG